MKIDIGGGQGGTDGYEALDVKGGRQFNWGTDTMPFDDNSIDGIYSSHTIEHVPWYNVQQALAEAYRVLKPGCEIEIHTPDLDYLIDHLNRKKCGDIWNARGRNPNMDYVLWFNSRVFNLPDTGEGMESAFWHRSSFNFESLKYLMDIAGFKNISRSDDKPKRKMSASPINMCIKAVK